MSVTTWFVTRGSLGIEGKKSSGLALACDRCRLVAHFVCGCLELIKLRNNSLW